MKEWGKKNFITEEENIEIIKRLRELGITIIAGTDAPNAELNFGEDLLRELDLYSQAGMSNIEILRTANPKTWPTMSLVKESKLRLNKPVVLNEIMIISALPFQKKLFADRKVVQITRCR